MAAKVRKARVNAVRTRRLSRREWAIQARCASWGVPYSNVSRAGVWRASAWLCGICGLPVDRALRFPHVMSKSLDHIVPLSVPGSPGHVTSNCQLAHLSCNSRKGGVNRLKDSDY